MNRPNELTKRVTAHLDEIRKHLGKLPADERQEILQSIESHIYDALESRSEGKPTPALLDAVLAEMDPPESYGESIVTPKKKTRPGLRIISGIFIIALLSVLLISVRNETSQTPPLVNQNLLINPIQIIEGVGWDDVEIGTSGQILLSKLGAPDEYGNQRLAWEKLHISCYMKNDKLESVKFGQGFEGETTAGIRIGSTENDAIKAYGDPDSRVCKKSKTLLRWKNKGLDIELNSLNLISEIRVYDSFESSEIRRPISDEIVGRWVAIDYVPTMSEFHPKCKIEMPRWPPNFVHEIIFLPDGSTKFPQGTWENGIFYNSDNGRGAALFIRKTKNDSYLFHPWGITKKSPEEYLVFKKDNQYSVSPQKVLTAGQFTGGKELFPKSLQGTWESVDFVSSIEQFDPETKSWRGDLALGELTFLPDGKTDRPFWTWKEGILHHSGDNTDARFTLKTINGEEYLFLEWMSGDVLHKGLPPKYYVLKKVLTNL
jgi:hypothetical protein